MALSDFESPKLEHYGGIDLKKNYRKYFGSALGISIGLHVLVILLYLGWTWFSEEDEKKIPVIHVHNLAELAPPPSTQDQPQEAMPLNAPPPAADMAKPNFGVPVPVPDAIAPTAVMPDLNNLPVQGVPGGEGSVASVVSGNGNAPVQLAVKEEKEPDPDEFVSVEQEPNPIKPLQSLVEYPELAKRAGIQGKVTLRALVGKDGKVEKVMIDKSSGSDVLDNAAKAALMKAQFTPARQNGQPVKVWFDTPIVFKLN